MAKLKPYVLILAIIAITEFWPFGAWCFSFLPEKTIKMDRFLGRCPGQGNLPVYFKDVHFTPAHRIYYISAKIVVTRDLSRELKVLLQCERCRSKEALDSCEPYPDVNIKNMCDLVGANFQPWTPFIKNLRPEFRCPVHKGTYTTTNGTFDGGAFMALPVEGWYWKIHAKVFETINKDSNMIMCIYIEGQIVNV